MAALRQNSTRFLSLATVLLALGGTIQSGVATPQSQEGACSSVEMAGPGQFPDAISPIERLQELLDMICFIVPCVGASTSEVTLAQVEQLAVIRMATYHLSGINPGLTQDDLYTGIGIVDQTEKWIQTNPGLLSSGIESDLASTLAEMRAELEEGLR